ncbi:MAG: response regulator transcription factor, partial [Bacteroidota bacterium]
ATEKLTQKEMQVLEKIGAGLTNKQIAAALFISESTVKTHINNIYRKTGLNSRTEAREYFSTLTA